MAMQALALILLGLAACASAQYSSCPEPYGLQLYPHEQYCDKFYKCANGELLYFHIKRVGDCSDIWFIQNRVFLKYMELPHVQNPMKKWLKSIVEIDTF